jgi:hypothetical protein
VKGFTAAEALHTPKSQGRRGSAVLDNIGRSAEHWTPFLQFA